MVKKVKEQWLVCLIFRQDTNIYVQIGIIFSTELLGVCDAVETWIKDETVQESLMLLALAGQNRKTRAPLMVNKNKY